MAGTPRFIPLNPSASTPVPLAPSGALAPRPGLAGLGDDNPYLDNSVDGGHATPAVPDGAVTGIGNLTGGQALAAFGQGALSGLPGVGLGQNIAQAINTSSVSPTEAAQMAMQAASLASTIMSGLGPGVGIKAGLGGLISLATAAQNSVGPPAHGTFAQAAQTMKSDLAALFGLGTKAPAPTIRGMVDEPDVDLSEPDVSIPDATFTEAPTVAYPDIDVAFPDVNTPDATFTEAPTVTYPDMNVAFPDVSIPDGISDGGISGISDGLSDGSGASGPGGDAAWFHGGPVHGPPGRDRVPGHLTAGEYVIDQDSSERFPGVVRALNAWERGDPVPRGLRGLIRDMGGR